MTNTVKLTETLQNCIEILYTRSRDQFMDREVFPIPGPMRHEIRECYREPHRKYRDFCHINTLLRLAFRVPRILRERHDCDMSEITQEQYCAILAHDLVYTPGNSLNEYDSIEKFFGLCLKYNYSLTLNQKMFVEECVLATKTHEKTDNQAINFILDLDMSGFAVQSICEQSAILIHEEFMPVIKDETIYLTGRKQFLESTLAYAKEKGIYSSYPFTLLNDEAIKNIELELANLK